MASDLIERLRTLAGAYPKDIFPPVSQIEAMQVSTIYPGLVDRCSAAMGRHFEPTFVECADALAAQAAEIERLTKEIGDLEEEGCRRDDECAKAEARADALAARVAELEAALRQIEGWEPATQEVTLAHQMANLALAALHPKAPAPAGEAEVRDDGGAKAWREGAIAGWNACRRSIYASCEDVDKEAEAAGKHEGEHALGYARGMARAAKSIARGFCAMEAEDDDNLISVLQGTAPAGEGGGS